MARNVDTRTSRYTIGFVCEGEKSEPFFIKRLHASLTTDSFGILVHPKTQEELREEQEETSEQSARKEGTKQVKNHRIPDPLLHSYNGVKLPTNWVLAGEELLDTCNEVWVLFDKDGHSDVLRAFAEIDRIRKIHPNYNVVFSSRCFEYYMLMHYEYSAKAYEKAECNHKNNKKTVLEHCCTDHPSPNACDGSLCINGHARANAYWEESKNNQVYDVCRNLWWGVLNSFHVKWHSLLTYKTQMIYERNPYLNIYHLTLRMLGMGCLEPFEPAIRRDRGAGTYHTLSRVGNKLHFECYSNAKIHQIEFREYRLLTDAELKANESQDQHFRSCLIQTHTIVLNVTNGESADVDISQYGLDAMDKYGIIEWDGIDYFVAPICEPITIGQAEYDAQRVEHVDSMLLKQQYKVVVRN